MMTKVWVAHISYILIDGNDERNEAMSESILALEALGFQHSRVNIEGLSHYYEGNWFSYGKPNTKIPNVIFVEMDEDKVVKDGSLDEAFWIALGDTYPVRDKLKKHRFKWNGDYWYKEGVDKPDPIEGLKFLRHAGRYR